MTAGMILDDSEKEMTPSMCWHDAGRLEANMAITRTCYRNMRMEPRREWFFTAIAKGTNPRGKRQNQSQLKDNDDGMTTNGANDYVCFLKKLLIIKSVLTMWINTNGTSPCHPVTLKSNRIICLPVLLAMMAINFRWRSDRTMQVQGITTHAFKSNVL